MVYIDADGCPVTHIAEDICRQAGVSITFVCDTAHYFESDYAEVINVDKGADSADMKIFSLSKPGDIIVTQDYGVATMCIAKKCKCISQDGMIYNEKNIDSLLMTRYITKKIRNSGGKLKGPSKRKNEQDDRFREAFKKIIGEKR